MRILKDNSIGLIIDLQERLFPHIHNHEEIAHNTEILIKGLQSLEVPLLVTEQYPKGLGFTIPKIKTALGGEVLEKTAFSCCDDEGFSAQLRESGKKFVIIAGIESHVCVLQTVVDLLAGGYQPVVVEDCTGSRKPNDKGIAMARIRREGAIVSTYESVLFELCRFSGTQAFKSISKLVK